MPLEVAGDDPGILANADQHMVRGRTTAPAGMVLGHEVTGEMTPFKRLPRWRYAAALVTHDRDFSRVHSLRMIS
jgi:hypothetical protein